MTNEEFEQWYDKNLQRLVLNIQHDPDWNRYVSLYKEIRNLAYHFAEDAESWVRFQNLVNTIKKPAKRPETAQMLPG